MEALTRQEYPAMLERLQPVGAVTKLNERVKKIGKMNADVADWLQERRKVEDAYVVALKRLSRRPLGDSGGDLGVFAAPWAKIMSATDSIANSHAHFSHRIDKDLEQALRGFSANNAEMQAMNTTQSNLNSIAREFEDAQDKSDKLNKKGGKASAQKMQSATTRLEKASQQWDSQAPFIFETLQALDETRLNHLRDVLTQYETLEADLVETKRVAVEETLSSLLEIDTSIEIRNWSQANVAGKPPIPRRETTQLSSTTSNSEPPSAPTPRSLHASQADNISEHSSRQEPASDFKLKSRIGTMLSRRRQSTYGSIGRPPSPLKPPPPLPRNLSSRDGKPTPSPRASSNNLKADSSSHDNRLSKVAETPDKYTNGDSNDEKLQSTLENDLVGGSSSLPNGSGSQNPSNAEPGSPTASASQQQPESRRDSEGFTLPSVMNDPISQAQLEAQQENDQQQFKLDIKADPIQEQDGDAEEALSNVANTLRIAQSTTPSRRAGTVRGRRDVRNTIFMPSLNPPELPISENSFPPPSPNKVTIRGHTLAALSAGEHSITALSDSTSIRSEGSLVTSVILKHVEMHQPGLNASIVETVHAIFEDGEPKTMKINGEVALIHNKSVEESVALAGNELIRINDFPNLEAVGPNRTLIHQASEGKPDEFSLDVTSLSAKPSIAFTYRIHIDENNILSQAPLLLKPSWKIQGDKLGLVIEYALNPAYSATLVSFSNLVIVAVYNGPKASACQTKPSGVHVKEKSLVYWRLGDMTLSNNWHKIICRFAGAEGAVPEAGHLEARWEIGQDSGLPTLSGISLSRLESSKGKEREESDDPFADADPGTPSAISNWVEITSSKKSISGKYEVK